MNTTDQVTTIVDKLSEKVGLAADKLAPIAEEVIRQTQTLGMVSTLAGIAIMLVGFLVTWKLILIRKQAIIQAVKDGEQNPVDACIGYTILTVTVPTVVLVASLLFLIEGVYRWIAPLPYLLKL